MIGIVEEEYAPCVDDDLTGQLNELITAIKALKPGEVLSIKAVDRLNALAVQLHKEVNG